MEVLYETSIHSSISKANEILAHMIAVLEAFIVYHVNVYDMAKLRHQCFTDLIVFSHSLCKTQMQKMIKESLDYGL